MSARPLHDWQLLRDIWRAQDGNLVRLPRTAWTMPFDTLLGELEVRGATGFIDREISILCSPRGLKNRKRAVLTLLHNVPQDDSFWFTLLLEAVRMREVGLPRAEYHSDSAPSTTDRQGLPAQALESQVSGPATLLFVSDLQGQSR